MKIRQILMAICLSIISITPAYAGSCETLLCMAGKLQGQNGGASCVQPIEDYFNIVRYGKHGRFDVGRTSGARLGFLNTCPNANGDLTNQINDAYGAQRIVGW